MVHEVSPQVLVLNCSAIPDIEYSALRSLTEFEEQLHDADISLWLVALNPNVLPIIQSSTLGGRLGNQRMYPNLEQAVEAFQKQAIKIR